MTKIVENNRILMYKGQLSEYYLTSGGQFNYLVLSKDSRFFMIFDGKEPSTGKQLELFRNSPSNAGRMWDYLMLHGDSISNVLFEKVPEVTSTSASQKELDEAISKFTETIRARRGSDGERLL